jgi:hypothetical protein
MIEPALRYSGPMADFGPNRDAVESFLERLRDVDQGQALALAASWKAADESRRRLAWRAVRRAARAAKGERALKDAQSAVMDWSNSWTPIPMYGYPGTGVLAEDLAQVMRDAVPPLVDAVSALVVGGLIDSADFEVLYGPWRSVDEGASPA